MEGDESEVSRNREHRGWPQDAEPWPARGVIMTSRAAASPRRQGRQAILDYSSMLRDSMLLLHGSYEVEGPSLAAQACTSPKT